MGASLYLPLIVVSINAGMVDLRAVVHAAPSGMYQGRALARVLLGEVSPAGRLPITYYANAEASLPDMSNYTMVNRTYRFFHGPVLYPFGYGLSYTSFSYSAVSPQKLRIDACEVLHLSVRVSNVGPMASDEVVQAYVIRNGRPALR